jgi:hypothetical protein
MTILALNLQHIVINLMTYYCMLCQCWSYFFHWFNIDKMSNVLVLYQCHFKTWCYSVTLTSYQWLYQHWTWNILLRCCKSIPTKRGQVCDAWFTCNGYIFISMFQNNCVLVFKINIPHIWPHFLATSIYPLFSLRKRLFIASLCF